MGKSGNTKSNMNTEIITPAIRTIVESVRKGHIFDSHFVIDMLIKEHSDEYLRFAASFDSNFTTAQVHGQIAIQTSRCDDLVESQDSSWSEHIHGETGPCECWRRRHSA